jgi:hypothetical protein
MTFLDVDASTVKRTLVQSPVLNACARQRVVCLHKSKVSIAPDRVVLRLGP